MATIYITVDKDHREDDIIDLVETLRKMFGKDHIQVQDTLAISSDLPQVMALIRSIPTNGEVAGEYGCIDCGKPVSKKNIRCRNCAQKIVGRKKREQRSAEKAGSKNGGILVENEADAQALMDVGLVPLEEQP